METNRNKLQQRPDQACFHDLASSHFVEQPYLNDQVKYGNRKIH